MATATDFDSCICGNTLLLTIPDIYGPRKSIYCNHCFHDLSKEIIYHCIDISNRSHKYGYDLCCSCYSKYVTQNKHAASNSNIDSTATNGQNDAKNKSFTRWTCKCCTLVNDNINTKCAACLQPKLSFFKEPSSTMHLCKGNDLSNCPSCHRLQIAMNNYKNDQNTNCDNNQMILDDFLHLLLEHNTEEEFERITNKLLLCDINNCNMFTRNYRDRSNLDNNNHTTKLYKTIELTDIVWKQIFDKIHCHYSHCFDVGNRMSLEDKEKLNELNLKEEKQNHSQFVNIEIIHRYSLIKEKQKLTQNKTILISRMNKRFHQLDLTYSFGTNFNYGYAQEHWSDDGVVVMEKYKSLKEELTTNPISTLTVEQFNMEYEKAMIHFNSSYCKTVLSLDNQFSLNHVLALMVYCNYDVLQGVFSRTYRDNIKQHNNYYHLGKYIKMAVTQFGTGHAHTVFYHGISDKFAFPAYIGNEAKGVVICGPLSTSSSFEVATNFANSNNGLVVHFVPNETKESKTQMVRNSSGFKMGYSSQCFVANDFSVAWLSDYPAELEHLFIQMDKRTPLIIDNIIDVQTGIEYKLILKALRIIHQITYIQEIKDHSIQLGGRSEAKKTSIEMLTVSCEMMLLVSTIIYHQLSSTGLCDTFNTLSEYAKNMIVTFCNNQRKAEIDFVAINKNLSVKQIMNSLIHDKIEWIKLTEMNILFPNLKGITIKHINLSVTVLDDIYEYLKDKDKSPMIKILPSDSSNLSVQYVVSLYKMKFEGIKYHISAQRLSYDRNMHPTLMLEIRS